MAFSADDQQDAEGEFLAEAPAPFSHSEHVSEMGRLYLQRLRPGRVSRETVYWAYYAGFFEGVWTERVHPAGKALGVRKEAGDGDD